MGKKTFSIAFQPARLVMGTSRWYIVWYAPHFDDDWHRYRETFNLNRIHDLRARKRRGEALRDKINWWLDQGLPAWEFSERGIIEIEQAGKNPLLETNVCQAVAEMVNLKVKSLRPDSARSYKSVGRLFNEFMDGKEWGRLRMMDFSKRHAAAYMDSCFLDRKVSSTTYNNNIRTLRSIFNELVAREYTQTNHFNSIPYKPKEEKRRRNFTLQEAKTVCAHLQKDDPTLFRALLFQYCCYLRPKEVRFLKFQDVNLSEGLVFITRTKGKTKRDRYMTIPDEFKPYFDREFFSRYPGHYYIFGEGLEPHATTPSGKSSLYRRHQRVLNRLKSAGKLGNIDGLQWYSWKDTGITDALEDLPILAVQDQAGHTTPGMTLKYRHRKKVNSQMKGFKNRLL